MPQKIGITSEDIDDLTANAIALHAWLDIQADNIKSGLAHIPPELRIMGMSGLVLGASFLIGEDLPGSICWGGGCSV